MHKLYRKILVQTVHLDLKNFLIRATLSRYHAVCVCVCAHARTHMQTHLLEGNISCIFSMSFFLSGDMAIGDVLKGI